MGKHKGIEYLDSKKLEDAAKKIDECAKNYKEVIKTISTSTNQLLDSWHGEGEKEFEKDYSTIYQQLTDIGDIMYDLYDALIDADATYVKADEEISKSFETEG